MGQPDDVLGDGVRGRRGRRDPRSASTVVGPLYGKLGDLYGRKRVLQAALVLFLVGSALCGLAQSMCS